MTGDQTPPKPDPIDYTGPRLPRTAYTDIVINEKNSKFQDIEETSTPAMANNVKRLCSSLIKKKPSGEMAGTSRAYLLIDRMSADVGLTVRK